MGNPREKPAKYTGRKWKAVFGNIKPVCKRTNLCLPAWITFQVLPCIGRDVKHLGFEFARRSRELVRLALALNEQIFFLNSGGNY